MRISRLVPFLVFAAVTGAWSQGADVWTKLTSGVTSTFNAVSCPNRSVCYAAGAVVRKTTDGGAGWVTQSGVTSVNGIDFVSVDTGYIASNGGIYATVNGGTTWARQATYASMMSVHCLSSRTCVAAGIGRVAVTTDGATWKDSASGMDGYAARFAGNTAWAAGSSGKAYQYNQLGTGKWASRDIGSSLETLGLFFLNANTGWAIGTGERIFKTEDGGASWTPQKASASGVYGYNLRFVNSGTGYAVGYNVHKTTNSGTTWTKESVTLGTMRGFTMADTAVGYAVGESGNIWKLTRPEVVVGVQAATNSRAVAVSRNALRLEGAGVSVQARGRTFDSRGRVEPVKAKDLSNQASLPEASEQNP
jgi:photosystem II stability/assembly factor-like uncharacterized protein